MLKLRDNPSEWTSAFYPAPANFDRAGFQAQLNRICGTVNGEPIVHIVWGAEEEIEVAEAITSLGSATKMVRQGRHMTRVKGVPGKVRKRRWIFEEFQPPEQIQHDGFMRVPGAAGLYLPPSLMQEQLKGKWLELYIVADHSKCPTEVCNSLEYFCFGDYREPDASDLAKLARITAKKAKVDHPDPFTPIGQNEIDLFNKQAAEEAEAAEQAEQTALENEYSDIESTLKRHSVSGTITTV